MKVPFNKQDEIAELISRIHSLEQDKREAVEALGFAKETILQFMGAIPLLPVNSYSIPLSDALHRQVMAIGQIIARLSEKKS